MEDRNVGVRFRRCRLVGACHRLARRGIHRSFPFHLRPALLRPGREHALSGRARPSFARRTSRPRRRRSISAATFPPRAPSSEDSTRVGAPTTWKTVSTILLPRFSSASSCRAAFPSPRLTARRDNFAPATCSGWRTLHPARDTSRSWATSLDSSCSFADSLSSVAGENGGACAGNHGVPAANAHAAASLVPHDWYTVHATEYLLV